MAVKYVLTSKCKSQMVSTFCIGIFTRSTIEKKSLKNVHSVLRYREFLSGRILSSRGQGHSSRSTKSNFCTAPYRYGKTCKEFVSIDIAIFATKGDKGCGKKKKKEKRKKRNFFEKVVTLDRSST